MQPLAVAGNFCRYLIMVSGSKKGIFLRKLRLAACRSVCHGWTKKAWCVYYGMDIVDTVCWWGCQRAF